MDNINDINSYNSITMSPSLKKELRSSTSYSSTKINLNELNKTLKNTEMNPFKRVSIELHNNIQRTSINIDKALTNTQNISTKDEDSSSSTLTKLPKIQKHINNNTNGSQNLISNNFFLNENNSTNNFNQKDLSSMSDATLTNSGMARLLNNSNLPNSTKNRSSYMGSANRIYSNIGYKQKNYDSIISPPDPLLKRTVVPKVNPRFGKMKAYIPLPEFKGEEPFTKFEYKPILKEMLTTPSIEKQYEVSLYINSYKMLNNLIYLKTQLNKDGLISLENLVNVKKLNKYYKNEDEEEEEIMQIEQTQNNFSGNILENNINNIKENNLNTSQDNNIDLIINGNKQYEEETIINNNTIKDNTINNRVLKTGPYAYDNKCIRPKTVYNELKPYYNLKNKNDNTLIFESRFESGNLLCAFKTEDENSYQLYLQNDTNTTGYIQWFFFRVSNTKKGRKVNFNIINMLRKTCVYNHGLKIMTYSIQAAAKENLGWHRDCYNSIYYANNLFVYNNNNANKKRNLHSLSFDYEFKYDNDTVYFANCIPYFYSTLMKELNKYELDDEKYPFFYRKTLTVTLGGNDLDMFTINSMYDIFKNGVTSIVTQKSQNYLYVKNNKENNNNNNLSQILDERKAIVIIGRQHPGETVGSYVVKGFIDFLMGDSEEAKKLREVYVFKIIPMMNPDGVLVGNSRTSFAGCDLNRRWGKPNEIIHPEVYSAKQMILKLANQRNIAFIIDCHGHFGAFNSLFYCNYKDNKRTCKLFPYICSKLSKIINFQQCTFAMPRYKMSTERIVLFNELEDDDNNNIVALETSFFGINRTGEYSHLYFNTKLLKEIGRDICIGMLSYYYKYENTSVEPNLFNNNDLSKKLDVDMREFEDEIIREVNEEEDEIEINDEKSESEPSVDNLDKNQIMRLMPTNGKKRRRKKNRFKKFDKKKDNKNRDLNIELFNPIKEAAKKLEEEKKKKVKAAKIIINCNFKAKITRRRQTLITDSNMKSEYTQTEEIFFKMHWSYFSGQYKIMSCSKFGNFVNNNFDISSSNLFGQLKRNNLYRKNLDDNLKTINKFNGMNPVIRAKSFNNKIILNNNRNSVSLNGANNNMNIINSKKYYNNNIKKTNININKNDNEQKNNVENNNNEINEENRMKMFNNNKNKLFNFAIDKNPNNNYINKDLIKKNTSPFIMDNITKNKQNGAIRNFQKEERNLDNNFLSTKYNNFNNNKYNDNIKLKMAKSSTSFYKK